MAVASFYIVADLSWRRFYWIVSIPAGIGALFTFIFVIETKYDRPQFTLEGDTSHLRPGEVRPELDWTRYDERPWGWQLFARECRWREAGYATLELLKVCFFPNIMWLVLINSCFMGNNLAASMTNAVILLEQPFSFPFRSLGLINVPLVISSLFYFVISGWGADKLALWLTRRNNGIREPEHQLINFILPILAEVVSTSLFGAIANNPENFHWIWMFVSMTIGGYGFLSINSVSAVYATESYPYIL